MLSSRPPWFHLAVTLPSPSFSFPYTPATWVLVLLSLHFDHLLFLSWSDPVCWPCSIHYFLSLLWIIPGASGFTLPHIYNKNLPLSHILGWLWPHFINLTLKLFLHLASAVCRTGWLLGFFWWMFVCIKACQGQRGTIDFAQASYKIQGPNCLHVLNAKTTSLNYYAWLFSLNVCIWLWVCRL